MNIVNCPQCKKRMSITRLQCTPCDLTIEGRFTSDRFALLDEETMDFMEVFVLARGNITEIEKRLGISYPTVKAKIDRMVDDVKKVTAREKEEAVRQERERLEKSKKQEMVKEIVTKK